MKASSQKEGPRVARASLGAHELEELHCVESQLAFTHFVVIGAVDGVHLCERVSGVCGENRVVCVCLGVCLGMCVCVCVSVSGRGGRVGID